MPGGTIIDLIIAYDLAADGPLVDPDNTGWHSDGVGVCQFLPSTWRAEPPEISVAGSIAYIAEKYGESAPWQMHVDLAYDRGGDVNGH
jgi:hypothetical protein